MQFSVSDDGQTYTGLTTGHVYEVVMQGHGVHWASWLLRVRDRARPVGVPLQWRDIDTYKNPATAMAWARHEEENRNAM